MQTSWKDVLLAIIVLPFFWMGLWVKIVKAFLDSLIRKPWDPKGKVVVITGASSGIGKELALRYAQKGAKLALCARRSSELSEVSQLCKNSGSPEVFIKQVDVSKENECKAFMEDIGRTFGVVDCLILNAGISMGEAFEEMDDPSILRTLMEVNFFGSVHCTFYGLPFLKKSSSGKIVVISSAAGLVGMPSRCGYSASKFALNGFFESIRKELFKYGIRVTIICPGVIQTDINRTRLGKAPKELDMKQGMPLDQAGKIMWDAISNDHEELTMTTPIKVVTLMKPFFGEIVDWLAIRMMNQVQSAKERVKKEA